ncbi:MAG TPA: hypothetical protein VEP49_03080 [Acidimicrobiia bacterium]|nr:hypothetical protein [Acidimicrobiia bacterium]
MSSSLEEQGSGWIGFAGIMLIIVGALNIVNGLNALDHKNSSPVAGQLMYANLETWGWIMLIWGIIVLVAGFLVFSRNQFGRWIGIIAASIAMIINMTWVFAFPIAALIEVFLAALVLYALIVYGGRESSTV